MMNSKEPENRLQEFIDSKGYSVAELSRLSKISDKTIRKMLIREKTERRSKIKVAKPFSVPAKEIFPYDPEL